jgi:O-antigen ligase
MNNPKEKFLKYGILFIIFFTPLVFWNQLFSPLSTPHTFFLYGTVNILLQIWLYFSITDEDFKINNKLLYIFSPLFLYVFWMSLAGILAVESSLSLWSSFFRGTGLVTLYYLTGFSFLIANLISVRGKNYLNLILKIFIVSSFFVALSVWVGDEGFKLPFSLFRNFTQGGGVLGNSSLVATYLMFPFFMGIYLLFDNETTKKWKIFIMVTLASILFSPLFVDIHGFINDGGLLGSGRGATLGILLGIGFGALVYLAISKKKIIKTIGITGIFLSLVIFSFCWVELMKPDSYIHNKFVDVTSGSRFIFWKIAEVSMNEKPLFGYGPENYSIAFKQNLDPRIYLPENGAELWTDKAHNIYYDIGVSGGYPAILFYSIFILSIFYFIYKLYQNNKISRIQTSILFGLIVGYIFQNLFVFDTVFSLLALFMLAGLFYGLNLYSSDNKIEEVNSYSKNQLFRNIVGILIIVFFSFTFYYFSIAPVKKAKMLINIAKMNLAERPDNYKNVLGISRAGDSFDLSFFLNQRYQGFYSKVETLKSDKDNFPLYEKDLSEFIQTFEKISDKNEHNYMYQIDLLNLYTAYMYLTGNIKEPSLVAHVFNLLDKAFELSPRNPEVSWEKAKIYIWQDEEDKAIEEFQKAILLEPHIPNSYQLLLDYAQEIKNDKLYKETLKQAQVNIPGFIPTQ